MNRYLKKFSGTVVTVLVFMILLAAIFVYRLNKEEKTEEGFVEVKNERVFGDIDTNEIQSMMFWANGSEVGFEKKEDGWHILKEDVTNSADSFSVGGLLAGITSARVIKAFTSGDINPSDFGFDKPSYELLVITPQKEYYMQIGDESPVGTGRYLNDVSFERVLITDDSIVDAIRGKTVSDFRDRTVLDIDYEEVYRIGVRVADFVVYFDREDEAWFVEAEPDGGGLEERFVENMISPFTGLKVSEHIDEAPDDPGRYGLDSPVAEIEIYYGDRVVAVLFGDRKDEDSFYVKLDNGTAVYSVPKNLFKILPKSMEDIK